MSLILKVQETNKEKKYNPNRKDKPPTEFDPWNQLEQKKQTRTETKSSQTEESKLKATATTQQCTETNKLEKRQPSTMTEDFGKKYSKSLGRTSRPWGGKPRAG